MAKHAGDTKRANAQVTHQGVAPDVRRAESDVYDSWAYPFVLCLGCVLVTLVVDNSFANFNTVLFMCSLRPILPRRL